MSATTRPPGRPRSTEADAAITRATLEVLREEGFRGLSVEAVRQRAGVGKATIYRRFPDKEALVRAAIAEVHQDLEAPDTGSLTEDLQVMFDAGYRSGGAVDPARVAPLLLAEAADDPELHAIFRAVLIDPRRAVVRQILERAVDRGELRGDVDLDLVIDLLAGPVIYRLLIDAGDPTVVARRGTSHVQTLLEGLAPRPA